MLAGTAGSLVNGAFYPLAILIFGNLINTFTDRTTNLCTLNYTALATEYCPPGYQLTASNFFLSLS
jgi:hypothetical protein